MFNHLNLREIEEENGSKYHTLEQYVHRTKTEGNYFFDKEIKKLF